MANRYLGNLDIVNLEPRVEGPLDARVLCGNLSQLVDKTWWNGASMYNGMQVTVQDSDGTGAPGIYVLTNARDYENILAWRCVSSTNITDDELDAIKDAVLHREANAAYGYAKLDGEAKILVDQLPSYVQEVITVDKYADLPNTGKDSVIYVIKNGDAGHPARSSYRWSGAGYIQIPTSLIIGEILGTAYDGSRGYALEEKVRNIEDIVGNTDNLIDTSTSIVNKLNTLVQWYDVKN